MNAPGLSVIIPNYNHAQCLPRCLEAMLGQSVQAREILVLDDASTDDSVGIIESYARRFPALRLIRNERNQGVIPTINHGLQLAAQTYVYFGAADDFILPGFFEQSLALLNRHPQAALCCSIGQWRDVVSESVRVAGETMAQTAAYLSPARMVELETQSRLLIASQTVIIKREALLRAGSFNPDLKWFCDWFANYVAGFREGICFVPQALTVFNTEPGSYSRSGRSRKRINRQVLLHMLELLEREDYADAAEPIRQSGALYLFGKPMLQVMLCRPRFWRFLTPAFVRKTLTRMASAERRKWQRSLAKRLGKWPAPAPPPKTPPE